MQTLCNCDERFIEKDGNRVRYPEIAYWDYHDCSYVMKRNQLLQKAETNVINKHGFNLPGPRFTRLFSLEMDRLAHEAKLI